MSKSTTFKASREQKLQLFTQSMKLKVVIINRQISIFKVDFKVLDTLWIKKYSTLKVY